MSWLFPPAQSGAPAAKSPLLVSMLRGVRKTHHLREVRGAVRRAAAVQARSFLTGASTTLWGVPVTSSSQLAVDSYDQAVHEYVSLSGDPVARCVSATEEDPGMVAAHVLGAMLYLLSGGVTAAHPAVLNARRRCQKLVEKGHCNHRERVLVAALTSWAEGRCREATAILEGWLLEEPTDLLVLRLAHDCYYALGEQRELRDSPGRVYGAWSTDQPGYSKMVGMFAFGAEENGDLQLAEREGMRAVAEDRHNVWAVHALAHVYEAQSRRNEGLRIMNDFRDFWDEANLLFVHMQWHLALFQLEEGHFGRAMLRYDTWIREDNPAEPFNLCDATSMLWRLELQGVKVYDRWAELVPYFKAFMGQHVLGWVDVHLAMCLAAAGEDELLADHMESMRRAGLTGPLVSEAHSSAVATPHDLDLPEIDPYWAWDPQEAERWWMDGAPTVGGHEAAVWASGEVGARRDGPADPQARAGAQDPFAPVHGNHSPRSDVTDRAYSAVGALADAFGLGQQRPAEGGEGAESSVDHVDVMAGVPSARDVLTSRGPDVPLSERQPPLPRYPAAGVETASGRMLLESMGASGAQGRLSDGQATPAVAGVPSSLTVAAEAGGMNGGAVARWAGSGASVPVAVDPPAMAGAAQAVRQLPPRPAFPIEDGDVGLAELADREVGHPVGPPPPPRPVLTCPFAVLPVLPLAAAAPTAAAAATDATGREGDSSDEGGAVEDGDGPLELVDLSTSPSGADLDGSGWAELVSLGGVGGLGLGSHSILDNKYITAAVALPLCEGMIAYRHGDFDKAVAKLLPLRGVWQYVGGSNAQRDVFEHTLAAAATQANQLVLARALLRTRVATRPNNGLAMYHLSSVHYGLGEYRHASDMRARGERAGLGAEDGGRGARIVREGEALARSEDHFDR